MTSQSLKQKIVCITGGGRGIGRATAVQLATHQARIVICSRSEKELQQTRQGIEERGSKALTFCCDVTQKDQVDSMVHSVEKQWGAIDILINNAGQALFKRIVDTSESEWDSILNANCKSAFLMTRAVLPSMFERNQGHIINVVSVAGIKPFYKCSAYCSSKYAMLGFTNVLRLETRSYRIKVTAFLPGAVDTDIWSDVNPDKNKMMNPEQVAEILVSTCLPDSSTTIESVILRPREGDL